jgi:excisionase family DNA binding protein
MQVETVVSGTPLAHKIPDACRRLGCGRTMIYELLAAGELRAIKLGNRTLIPESELQKFIESRLAAAA